MHKTFFAAAEEAACHLMKLPSVMSHTGLAGLWVMYATGFKEQQSLLES